MIRRQHEMPDLDVGWLPDEPVLTTDIITAWHEAYLAGRGGDLAPAIDLPDPSYRGSDAGTRCDRALYYKLAKEPVTEAFTLADHYTFMLGQTIHDMMQAIGLGLWPDAEKERVVDLRTIGLHGSMRMDLWLPAHPTKGRVSVEAKSRNGFGFKDAATYFNGPPQGPSIEHVVQACLGAEAEQADHAAVIYFSLEKLSPSLAKKAVHGEVGRVAAEWWLTPEQYGPIARAEVARANGVLDDVSAGNLSPRTLHRPLHRSPTATITNPSRGAWIVEANNQLVDQGTTWHCDYCPYRSKCIDDGAGVRLL